MVAKRRGRYGRVKDGVDALARGLLRVSVSWGVASTEHLGQCGRCKEITTVRLIPATSPASVGWRCVGCYCEMLEEADGRFERDRHR